ncbi:Ppx/GppA phosphatase family protein [Asaia prunellae]|uniref:Ppx/GppA phosphatase family protein n=1 Tax=Asaia prunellae TaxID=610245 RepID=UPI000A82BDF9|nr:hypothetical protein [Asaia prunellae]
MGYSRSETMSPHTFDAGPVRHFAALDLGTNNCRLMIARRTGGGVQILDRQNRMVCLGEGLIETGELSIKAMDRAVRTLESFAARMKGLPSLQIRAVATEACRRALNRESFLSRVHSETGLPLEIISPREEVELAVEGCRTLLHRTRKSGTRAIVFDIGGGSTEIAWLRLSSETHEHELVSLVSLPYGVVTLSEQYGHSRQPASTLDQADLYCRMVETIRRPLLAFESVHQINREMQRSAVQMLGTSGTVTTLASLAQNLTRYSRNAVDGFTLSAQAAHDAIALIRNNARNGELPPPLFRLTDSISCCLVAQSLKPFIASGPRNRSLSPIADCGTAWSRAWQPRQETAEAPHKARLIVIRSGSTRRIIVAMQHPLPLWDAHEQKQ